MGRQDDDAGAGPGTRASLWGRRWPQWIRGRLALAGLCIAGMAGLCYPMAAFAQRSIDVIPSAGSLVADEADLLTLSEERRLAEKLTAYADTTSTQIVVVTIPSLEGVPAAEYALALGRAWGVGQEGRNNGVVVLVSRDDREARIETGYGLEGAISDAVAARIYRNVMVPYFREGRFYEGLSATTDLLIAAAAGEYTAERAPARRAAPPIDPSTLFTLIIVIWFVVATIRRRRGGNDGGKRYRRHAHGPHFIVWGGGFGGSGGGFGGGLGGGGLGGGFGGFGGGGFGGGGAGGGW